MRTEVIGYIIELASQWAMSSSVCDTFSCVFTMKKSQPRIYIPEPWTVDKIRKKKKMQRDNYHKNKMDFDIPLDNKRPTNRRSEEMKQVLEDKTDS